VRLACPQLSQRLENEGLNLDLLAEIDQFVSRTFGLSVVQQQSIADTLATALPTAAVKKNAVRPTTEIERQRFVAVCEKELRSVLAASSGTASVREVLPVGSWRLVLVDRSGEPETSVLSFDAARFVEAADDAAATLVRIHLDESRVLLGIVDRYRYWTPTRARMLAAFLLQETPSRA
jgi:hypothetical protein